MEPVPIEDTESTYLESTYMELLARVDRFFERVRTRYPNAVRCTPGCSDCCQRDLSLFPFEAERIAAVALSLPAATRARVLARAGRRGEDAACPLLEEDGCCAVYAARSVICRTHGLLTVLGLPDRGAPPATAGRPPQVSLCPHNFPGAVQVAGDSVLDLEPVNRILATLNHLWCAQRGRSQERIRISAAILARAEALR